MWRERNGKGEGGKGFFVFNFLKEFIKMQIVGKIVCDVKIIIFI